MYPRIRELRKASNQSQEMLAKFLHVSQTTYSQYETGQREIPVEILIQLAQYYNTSADYLVGLVECRKPYPKAAPDSRFR